MPLQTSNSRINVPLCVPKVKKDLYYIMLNQFVLNMQSSIVDTNLNGSNDCIVH